MVFSAMAYIQLKPLLRIEERHTTESELLMVTATPLLTPMKVCLPHQRDLEDLLIFSSFSCPIPITIRQ